MPSRLLDSLIQLSTEKRAGSAAQLASWTTTAHTCLCHGPWRGRGGEFPDGWATRRMPPGRSGSLLSTNEPANAAYRGSCPGTTSSPSPSRSGAAILVCAKCSTGGGFPSPQGRGRSSDLEQESNSVDRICHTETKIEGSGSMMVQFDVFLRTYSEGAGLSAMMGLWFWYDIHVCVVQYC